MSTPKKLYAVIPLAHPATQPSARPKRLGKAETPKPVSILDQNFAYTSAAGTDLRARFKALGFKTPKVKKVR
jgi:hypothetical protein